MMYLLAFIGAIVFFLGWYISLTSWSRLTELGVEHKRSAFVYFDTILLSFLLALAISRVVWMAMNVGYYTDVPWGILPYVRTAFSLDWLTFFPWRVLRVTEGVLYPLLWISFGLFSSLLVYVPTILLAQKLKTDKRSVITGFILKSLLGLLVTTGYFVVLAFLSK